MKTFFLLISILATLPLFASVNPGDFASFRGKLNGVIYKLQRLEVISYDEASQDTTYKLTEEFEDGEIRETIETKKVLTENDGLIIYNSCEQYGETLIYTLPNQKQIQTCRVRHMNNPELYLDIGDLPFGFTYFHDSDGSFLELIDFGKK